MFRISIVFFYGLKLILITVLLYHLKFLYKITYNLKCTVFCTIFTKMEQNIEGCCKHCVASSAFHGWDFAWIYNMETCLTSVKNAIKFDYEYHKICYLRLSVYPKNKYFFCTGNSSTRRKFCSKKIPFVISCFLRWKIETWITCVCSVIKI